jgi:UPF0176 protein
VKNQRITLLVKGVENVSHLKGGILKYLEETPEKKSEWVGDCFVFDARVSVGHELKEGPHELCYACRQPILPKDKERAEYEHGVSCHKCKSRTTEVRQKPIPGKTKTNPIISKTRSKAHGWL